MPFVLPGDRIQFFYAFQSKTGGRLRVDKIERAAEYPPGLQPIPPICAHFGVCGGCRAQHLLYETQISLKTAPVFRELRRVCGIEPVVLPAPATRGHRNRMDFVVNGDTLGLHPASDHSRYVDIEHCPVQRQPANAALELCRAVLARHAGAGFVRGQAAGAVAHGPLGADAAALVTPVPGSGALKYVTIRCGAHGSGVIVLTVYGPARELPDYIAFREELAACLAAHPELRPTGMASSGDTAPEGAAGQQPRGFSLIECYTEPVENEVSCVPGGRVLLGSDTFVERLGGRDFVVPYDSFFQPAPEAFDLLLEHCRGTLATHLEPGVKGDLLDLFCGSGVLSSLVVEWMPTTFRAVRGLELTASAVERAPSNFTRLRSGAGFGAENLHFAVADLQQPPADLFHGAAVQLLLADPPRAGLGTHLRALLARERPAPYFLYISCNPESQLRDLQELAGAYEALAACLVDCYPHTPHLEQAVLLRRRAT